MIVDRTRLWQPIVAAALVLVMVLSGAGRGWAAASDDPGGPAVSIAGFQVHICHSGPAGSGDRGSGKHDCCDPCALGSPLALAGAPGLTAPDRVEHFADHGAAATWAPAVVRPKSPRLSQGPPTA